MTLLQITLLLTAGVVVLGALCWGILFLERHFPSKQYDERQKVARGNAYRAGFYLGLVWLIASGLVVGYDAHEGTLMFVLFLGFVAQMLVFHIYCLLTHAAMPLSEKPWMSIASYGIMAVFYGVNVFTARNIDARWPDKPMVNTLIQLTMAVGFGSLSLMHLIQYLRDRKSC